MTSLDDALELAAAGWKVLPLRGKIPATQHGVKDATTDPDALRAWWGHRTDLNIGARVPDTLVVIDVDPQNGGSVTELEQVAGVALPETLTVISGRGTGGAHYYFRRPPGPVSARRLPAGIDVKTSSGYCVMPPSRHPLTGLAYRWVDNAPAPLPGEIIALLAPPTPVARAARSRRRGSSSVRGLIEHVERLHPGSRNRGVFWAACRAVENGETEETFERLIAAAIAIGLPEAEARQTIHSAKRVASQR